MKLFAALQFLAVTKALASSLKRTQALEISDLSANHYSNVTLGTLQFTIHDPNTDITDDCNVSWNTSSVIQPGLALHKCQHRHFEFGFRYGISDIEFFALVLQQLNGTALGYSVVTAYRTNPRWICVQGSEEGLQERCVWSGTLKVEVD
ncbi:rRNA-processing protein EBP2 [Penicillium atrosanguineum]|uniref:AA1-like domain-containing protein n=1 Tax=Penicillium atrosanguineum TaxID=1132637 RepID=A0A9W9U5W0_9EURO|nr:rRNA-processing protein EBP2 [Penicillium atrosanguineum]KAJ5122267.1 hypothetical protein N7526_009204 [Penicillium atrosanguineum]KAJ5309906.1 rRNA-processing protein EBP2 [Penicillium atrosanguineum]KAJ5315425.1 hypothetical protein N7476_005732 [Penicillium atrosanguineum]